MGGHGRLVVVEDAADEVGGFTDVSAVLVVGAVGLSVPVFVFGVALIEVGGVGIATAGHRHVKQVAVCVLAEHRMAGVSSDDQSR